MPTPTPQDARHEALEPYLQRVGAFLRARGDESRPITIPSTPTSLTLSAEERRAAFSALCGADPDWSDPHAWVALGTGLHLAVADLLSSMGDAGGDGNPAGTAARLAALRAAAANYAEGLRLAVSDMILAGRADEAKRLSSFRNKLRETFGALRNAGAAEAPPEEVPNAPAPSEPEPAPPPAAEAAVAGVEPPTEVDPVLDGYLRRTAAFLRARGREDRPLSLAFGRRALTVTAWERRIIWSALCEGRSPDRDWHRLIPHAIALQLAMLLALDELERSAPTSDGERSARLDLQAALTISPGVVEAFRAEITRAVATGSVEDAKTMSAARTTFAATLAEVRRALAEERSGGAGTGADSAGGGADARRLEALRPFLDRAEQLLRVHGHEDRVLSVPVGRRAWSLDRWERRVAWKVLCEESHGQPEWSLLVARGAAAQLAALLALERLRKAGEGPEARSAAEADRETAASFLSEIAGRLRDTGAALAADGQEALGERLAQFRAKLGESVDLLTRTRA